MRNWKIALAAGIALLAVPAAAQQRSLPVGDCVNLGNTFEVPKANELGKGALGPRDFARIRAAGFDTVRMPVRWDQRSKDTPPYTVDPAWMAQVKTTVDQALAAGLKVILNSHHFEPLYAAPIETQPWHTGVWRQIARTFADYPADTLWFELENEPHDRFDDGNLRKVLDPALAVVRESNPDRPVIIGGQNWSGIDSLATLDLPVDPNVYPTFHYYEPFDFTHQGAQWVAPDIPPVGRTYGTKADAARLRDDLAKVRAFEKRTGTVPFIGETGAYEAHIPLDQRIAYARAVHDTFVPEGVAVCQWAYANTFPLYDRERERWMPGLLEAIGLDGRSAAAGRSEMAARYEGAQPPAGLQGLDAQLPGTLINDPTRIDWPTQGKLSVEVLRDGAIPGGGAARRYTVADKPAQIWEAQTSIPLTAGIDRGQTVTVGFYARTASAATPDDKGIVGVRFQQSSAPYPGFGDATVEIGPDWHWYEVSATADRSIARDVANVVLQLGGAKQAIEIGQAIVVEGAPTIVQTAKVARTAPEPDVPAPLVGSGTLINDPADRSWADNPGAGTIELREDPTIWLARSTRVTVPAAGENPWDIGTAVPIAGAIAPGDNLLIAIAARTQNAATEDGKAVVDMRIQGTTPPHDGFAGNTFSVGPKWQLIRVKTTADRTFAAGEAQLALHFAKAAQTLDIGPVYIFKTN